MLVIPFGFELLKGDIFAALSSVAGVPFNEDIVADRSYHFCFGSKVLPPTEN